MTAQASRAVYALGLLALGAVAMLVLTLLPTLTFVDATGAAEPVAPIEVPRLDLPPYESFTVIAERPLFDASRYGEGSSAGDGGPPALSTYRLAGLVLSGSVRLALIERVPSKQVVTVHPGDTLDGRHVDDVRADGVHLSAGSDAAVLTAPKPKGSGWTVFTGAKP